MPSLTSDLSDLGDPGVALKPVQIAILTAFSTVVWFLAAMFIRFVGPTGVFQGYKVIALCALPDHRGSGDSARRRARVAIDYPLLQRISKDVQVSAATALVLTMLAVRPASAETATDLAQRCIAWRGGSGATGLRLE